MELFTLCGLVVQAKAQKWKRKGTWRMREKIKTKLELWAQSLPQCVLYILKCVTVQHVADNQTDSAGKYSKQILVRWWRNWGRCYDRRSDRPTGLSGSGGNKATLEFPRHSEFTVVSLSQNLHMGHLRVFVVRCVFLRCSAYNIPVCPCERSTSMHGVRSNVTADLLSVINIMWLVSISGQQADKAEER